MHSRSPAPGLADETLQLPKVAPPRRFRPEIQGLRAIAVLLVAVYHVWFGRVSGGVDVFLLLTGFLITASLMRTMESEQKLRPIRFLARLARRLLPTIAVVLFGVLAATYLWLPPGRWEEVLDQTIASALYYENWLLAERSVDYLTRDDGVSVLQHFWSLSIQGQFYLIWLAAMAVPLWLLRSFGLPLRWLVFTLAAAVFGASLTYSVMKTESSQAWAYFDTGARLWEFALGAMLAIVLPYLTVRRSVRIALGWIGIIALLSCGALFNVSTMFPGYIALWPLGASILLIVAGVTGAPFAVDRLLTWKPLMSLGNWSYALYLWHWPVLIVYLQVAGREEASWRGGIYVIATSIALAAITTWIIEDRIVNLSLFRSTPARSFSLAALFMVPIVAVASVAHGRVVERNAELVADAETAAADTMRYPGAAVVTDPELAENLPDVEFIPPLHDKDVPQHREDGCHVGQEDVEVVACEYGDPDGDRTIAMVGGSRIAHWTPAFVRAAEENGWRIVTFTKSGCQYKADHNYDSDGSIDVPCDEWNVDAEAYLAELKPDLVVMLATRAFGSGEKIYDGFLERWRQLDELGIQVLALRDIPRLDGNLPECIELHGTEECVTPSDWSQSEAPPEERYTGVPANTTFANLTPYVCPDGQCPATLGNIRTYRDHSHLTATFSATVAPYAAEVVREATGW